MLSLDNFKLYNSAPFINRVPNFNEIALLGASSCCARVDQDLSLRSALCAS